MHNIEPSASMPTYQKALLQTVVYKRVREIVSRALKPFGINTTQWMVLGILQAEPPSQKISAIAQHLQVEVPLITTLAQSLLRDKYISQTADQQDRRSKPLAITDSGRQLVADVEASLAGRLQVLETGLPAPALDEYFATLQRLIANAEAAEQKL